MKTNIRLLLLGVALSLQTLAGHAATYAQVSEEDAIRQAEAVVVGHLVSQGKAQQWRVQASGDAKGLEQLNEPVEEAVYLSEFRITAVLDGEVTDKQVTVALPAGFLKQKENGEGRQALLNGKSVMIGLSLDQMARRRDLHAYNIVHGVAVPLTQANQVDELKKRVAILRPETKPQRDTELEKAFGESGTGDDINLETPKPIIDHKGANAPEKLELMPNKLDARQFKYSPSDAKPRDATPVGKQR